MVKTQFSIPLYDVDVAIFQVESKEDAGEVTENLRCYDMSDELLDEVRKGVEDDNTDGGSTYWNAGLHAAVCVFYRMESDARKLVCYAHEKRHVEDRVLSFCNVDDKEAAAYLAGWLAEKFHEAFIK